MKVAFLILFSSLSLAILGQKKENDVVIYKTPNFKYQEPKYFIVIDSSEIEIDSVFLSKLNTRWIKEMKVLKDKEQISVYGNANGVLLIYLKRRFNIKVLEELKTQQ
jgi:hypothetical protein